MRSQPSRNPNGTLPTSPRNILAGCQFHQRNPIDTAASAAPGHGLKPAVGLIYATIAIPALTLAASTPEIPSMPSMKLNKLTNQSQRRAAAAASYQNGRKFWKIIPCEPTHAIAAITAAACATSRVTGESVRRSSIQEVMARAMVASNTILVPLNTGPGKYGSPLQRLQIYKAMSNSAMTAMPPPRGVGLLWLDRSTG